jgi:hypothetical protein
MCSHDVKLKEGFFTLTAGVDVFCNSCLSCCSTTVLFSILQSPLVPGLQGWLYVNGVQCLWTILLLAGTISGIRSTFIFMLVVLFPTLNSFVLSLSHWRNNRKFLMCICFL